MERFSNRRFWNQKGYMCIFKDHDHDKVSIDGIDHCPEFTKNIGYVYILADDSGNFFKIGRSKKFSRRIEQLKIQLPFKVHAVAVFQVLEPDRDEAWLHKVYDTQRLNGEWFGLKADELNGILNDLGQLGWRVL